MVFGSEDGAVPWSWGGRRPVRLRPVPYRTYCIVSFVSTSYRNVCVPSPSPTPFPSRPVPHVPNPVPVPSRPVPSRRRPRIPARSRGETSNKKEHNGHGSLASRIVTNYVQFPSSQTDLLSSNSDLPAGLIRRTIKFDGGLSDLARRNSPDPPLT